MSVKVTLNNIAASVTAGVKSLAASLQTIWDVSTGPEKQTFVDANDVELAGLITLTWAEKVTAYGIAYHYPAESQVTSYATADAAYIETNVFAPARDQGNQVYNSLASFFVLNNNNAFGNTNRFTAEDGTQTYTANLIIDHLTGLMWYRAQIGSAVWATNLANASGSDFGGSQAQAGYNNWFMPSRRQIHSIFDSSQAALLNYAPFNLNLNLQTSTTVALPTTQAYRFANSNDTTLARNKTSADATIICRKHY